MSSSWPHENDIGLRVTIQFFSSSFSSVNAKSNVKVDTLEIITNQYSNAELYNHGYTPENTIAAHVVGGITEANVIAKLYTYNGLLLAGIGDPGSYATTYPGIRVKLKILHI